MSSSPPVSPTGFVPPPSYQISQNELDQKTSQALQLSSSTTVDDDGWQIYNAAAYESVAESYEHDHSPPGSSSAGVIGFNADTSRHERQERRPSVLKLSSPTRHMKNRSSDRRRRNPQHDPEFPRSVTPPPPFTPTGPSLDGPPFEEVVGLPYRYSGLDSHTSSPLDPPLSPPRSAPLQTTQPVAPLRSPNHRFSDPHIPTTADTYASHRPRSVLPDVSPGPNPSSMVTRVEFDPQMAYSPYGGMVNHTSMQAGATAFYNHAVASQLATGPTTGPSTQSSFPERVSSPYSSGYPSTPYWTPQVTPSMSHLTGDEPHHQQDIRFSTIVPSTYPHPHPSSPSSISSTSGQQPSGNVRGPLPPVPSSNEELPHERWARSEAQLLQDIYGGNS
ncbi:hypothetical protein BGW80DRAFT_1249345 [Lactifluus volemus]|nr:hypothetical protein BGW80DRAFT_1249345 [Lactifluus volemus]